MQINELKLNHKRKAKRTIGRGGKKGTYSGRGMKGQKARSGASINPLFEGGRSTLVDHMKKTRGFKSPHPKKNIVKLSAIEKNFKDGDIISLESLLAKKMLAKKNSQDGIKILADVKDFKRKITLEKSILVSVSAKNLIEKAGGNVSL
ncbi:MAG: 50S ribosomal protein L15 [Patescibacteria group bacterium]